MRSLPMRSMAILLGVVTLVLFVPTGPAWAEGSISLNNTTVQLGDRNEEDIQTITLSAAAMSERHPFRIQLPVPLNQYVSNVGGATCQPSSGRPTDLTCTPSGTLTKPVISYDFEFAVHDFPSQVSYTVTVTDTITGDSASGQVTIKPAPNADLGVQAVPSRVGGLVRLTFTMTNHGPNLGAEVLLHVVLGGTATVANAPGECYTSGSLILCELGDMGVGATRQVIVDLTPIEATVSAIATVVPNNNDPNYANDQVIINYPANAGGSTTPPSTGGGSTPGSGSTTGTGSVPGATAGPGSSASPSVSGSPAPAAPTSVPVATTSPARPVAIAETRDAGSAGWIVGAIAAGVLVFLAAAVATVLVLRRRSLPTPPTEPPSAAI